MKKIKQFIYCGEQSEVTTPKANQWTTNLFSSYKQISHLGIQGPAHTKFCLNDGNNSEAITIGITGVYELDLGGIGYINSLRFLPESLSNIQDGKRIIVDFIYEGV